MPLMMSQTSGVRVLPRFYSLLAQAQNWACRAAFQQGSGSTDRDAFRLVLAASRLLLNTRMRSLTVLIVDLHNPGRLPSCHYACLNLTTVFPK